MDFNGVFKKVLLHELSLNDISHNMGDSDSFNFKSDHVSDSDEFYRLFSKCHKLANEKKIDWSQIKMPVIMFCNIVTSRHDLHAEDIVDIMHIGDYISIRLKGRPVGGAAGHFNHEFNDIFSIPVEHNSPPERIKNLWEDQIDLFIDGMQSHFDKTKDKHKHFRPEDKLDDEWNFE